MLMVARNPLTDNQFLKQIRMSQAVVEQLELGLNQCG